MTSKAPKASGLNGHSTPPAMAASIVPSGMASTASPIATAPAAQLLAVARLPLQVEGDTEVGRRRTAEDGQGQHRRDGTDAARQVSLVLCLGERDAAEGASDVDADPLRFRGTIDTRREGRVADRHRAGGEAELAEAVQRAGGSRVHVVEGLAVVDLRRYLRGNGADLEAVDAPHGRARARTPVQNASRPMPTADRTPSPVIQTRRRDPVTAADPPPVTLRRLS